jgi:hypothetical protein
MHVKSPVLLLLVLVSVAVALPLQADTEDDIRTALEYYAQVWNDGEVDELSGYYDPSFVLVSDEGSIPLGQQIDDLRSVGAAGGDRGELKVSRVTVRSLGDSHAMAYGLMELSFDDGSAIGNWFTTIYKKTPFGWKAILTRN